MVCRSVAMQARMVGTPADASETYVDARDQNLNPSKCSDLTVITIQTRSKDGHKRKAAAPMSGLSIASDAKAIGGAAVTPNTRQSAAAIE